MKNLLTAIVLASIFFSNHLKAASYKEILSDSSKYRAVRLAYSSLRDYLIIPVKVNDDKTLYFLLDSGITSTNFTLKGAKASGLELIATESTTSGVAGKSESYTVKVDSFLVGSTSKYSDISLGVTNIPALDKASHYGGIQISGVLGSDILNNLNAIIDYGSGILFIPKSKNDSGLIKSLDAAKFVKSPFVNFDEYKMPVLNSQVNGKPCLLVFDTGAKATLLTRSYCKQDTSIRVFDTATKLSGVAGNTTSQQAYVGSIQYAGITAKQNGVIVANLAHMEKKGRKNWSGIVGSDLMFPTKTLIDYGSKAIYTLDLEFNASEYGKAGLMTGSKEEIAARIARCETVATGKMTQLVFDKEPPLKDAKGNSYLKATITFQPMKTYKGNLAEGEKIKVKVIVPNTKTASQDLIDQAVTQPRRILLIPNGAAGKRILFSQTFLRTSAIRDAHLMKMME